MGTWGVLAFDNDSANDWAYRLDEINDLSLVESALDEVVARGEDDLDSDFAVEALAACELLARLRGNPGYTNAFTEKVDRWAAAHKDRLIPSASLLERASAAIDRIIGDDSELREMWEDVDAGKWLAAVEDLRRRMLAQADLKNDFG